MRIGSIALNRSKPLSMRSRRAHKRLLVACRSSVAALMGEENETPDFQNSERLTATLGDCSVATNPSQSRHYRKFRAGIDRYRSDTTADTPPAKLERICGRRLPRTARLAHSGSTCLAFSGGHSCTPAYPKAKIVLLGPGRRGRDWLHRYPDDIVHRHCVVAVPIIMLMQLS